MMVRNDGLAITVWLFCLSIRFIYYGVAILFIYSVYLFGLSIRFIYYGLSANDFANLSLKKILSLIHHRRMNILNNNSHFPPPLSRLLFVFIFVSLFRSSQ